MLFRNWNKVFLTIRSSETCFLMFCRVFMSDRPGNPGDYHWWTLLVLHESELLPVNVNSHVANTV